MANAQGSGTGFVVGLAFWPGGKESDWGDHVTGIQPCNKTQQANLVSPPCIAPKPMQTETLLPRLYPLQQMLTPGPSPMHPPQTAMGVHFAVYNARIDRLSVLKTTFSEQLALTADGVPGSPHVISVVAFR